ncbi:IBR finger domain containing protein [Fusarium agapanthi]|uniref:IBR finger domain containing protein n=1 Tax=Fusarium agapanthi TaxID=1803897 RepID=A0A9P5B875_9HYPO|nr:IBR finger domain containing protein [Fusarium agapanthi]
MDARQDCYQNASSEEALPVIVVRRSHEASTQRDRQYEQAPEQHFGEEPDTQDDSSNDVANLDDEMDTDDEGNEYMSDVLEDLSDGKSDSQPGEDSEESDDQDDEMTVDDEAEENSEDTPGLLSEGPPDSEQGEEREQQGHHPAAPQGPTTQEPVLPGAKVCICCIYPTTMAQRLPCGHDYCLPCLITAVELSISRTWHFPVQCCNIEVPPEEIEGSLLANDIQQYREKWAEYTTMDRTYCSNSQCLKFIPPNRTSDDGTPCYGDEAGCPTCNEVTCTRCKNKGHTGDCEQQVGPVQALALAESKGWKRCSRCGHLIELADGCSHMGMSPNQLVNLSNLLTYTSQYVSADIDPALQQHQLDAPPQPVPAAPNANRPQLPPMLCDHDWQRVENPGRCRVCREGVHPYTFECTTCTLRVCHGCRDRAVAQINDWIAHYYRDMARDK